MWFSKTKIFNYSDHSVWRHRFVFHNRFGYSIYKKKYRSFKINYQTSLLLGNMYYVCVYVIVSVIKQEWDDRTYVNWTLRSNKLWSGTTVRINLKVETYLFWLHSAFDEINLKIFLVTTFKGMYSSQLKQPNTNKTFLIKIQSWYTNVTTIVNDL